MMPEHQLKVDELVASITATLRIECHNLYNSGAVEVDEYDPDQYVLAKALVTAAMHRLKDNFAPRDPALLRFIHKLTVI